MPKTANKRAQARKATRVQRAHVEPRVATAARRVPAAKRRQQQTGIIGFIQRFPWATTLFILAVVAVFGLVLHNRPATPKTTSTASKPAATANTGKTTAASCDLKTHHCTGAPPMTIDVNKSYTATIKTDQGDIVIALDPKNAPNAVNNFVFLADQHYYDGTYFWRVETPGQVSPIDPTGGPSPLSLIQGGSVANNGQDSSSQPGYTIQDDKVVGNYTSGTVAMANTGQPNSASAQFFIDKGDESQYFSKTYSIFGNVTQGMDVVNKITPGTTIQSVTIAVK